MSKKVLVIVAFLFIGSAAAADNTIDICIQQKLKLSTPVNHVAMQAGDFRAIPYVFRSALQICHPTFDIVAGQIFKKMTRTQEKPSETEVKCFEAHLMRKNAEGMLVATFDRNLLEGFEGDETCAATIEAFTNAQIKQKMPNGTPAEVKCLRSSIDLYMRARFKAQVLSVGEHSSEIYDDEKLRFVHELREASEELVECLVALQ